MLGFYPLSTHPLSQLGDTTAPPTPGGGGDGAGTRLLTAHEKRRRKRHKAQLAAWAAEYDALLRGDDTPAEVVAVARVVAPLVETAPNVGDVARGVFAQFFPVDDAFMAPQTSDQRAQVADVARRLRHMVAEARRMADEDDEEAAIALLLM